MTTEVEIYADVVFLINLVMDFFIFWITGKLAGCKTTWLRLFIGSFLGAALYCATIFIEFLRPAYGFLSSMVILAISMMVIYRPYSIKKMLKLMLFANIAAFSIGGAGIALFYYTNIGNTIGSLVTFTISNISFKILISVSAASYIGIKLLLIWINRVSIKKQTFYPIKIFFENENVDLNALVDTGNSLKDPLSQSPVIIAEFDKIKCFIPDELQNLFANNLENSPESFLQNVTDDSFFNRLRMIPFHSIGKENGMLIGFKPDAIEIQDKKENTKIINDVVVGIYNSALSKNGNYQALINPEILSKESIA